MKKVTPLRKIRLNESAPDKGLQAFFDKARKHFKDDATYEMEADINNPDKWRVDISIYADGSAEIKITYAKGKLTGCSGMVYGAKDRINFMKEYGWKTLDDIDFQKFRQFARS